VCWTIEVADVEQITAAHIHVAPSTAPGPIVVPLEPYTGGSTDIDRELAVAIITDPSSYYVNVHNMKFRREHCADSSTTETRVGYGRG
jgi:hypothetical protein